MLAVLAVLVFFMFRNGRKRKRDLEALQSTMVPGAKIMTSSGIYGTITGEPQIVDDTLGGEPTEYEVEAGGGDPSGVTAGFQKTQPGTSELKVEILADDEVIVESRTFAEFGAANADWFPQIGLPEEFPTDEQMVLEDEEVVSEEESP